MATYYIYREAKNTIENFPVSGIGQRYSSPLFNSGELYLSLRIMHKGHIMPLKHSRWQPTPSYKELQVTTFLLASASLLQLFHVMQPLFVPGLNCCQDILVIRYESDGVLSSNRQWGDGTTNSSGTIAVTLPLTADIITGVVCDAGTNPAYYSFNASGKIIYGRDYNGNKATSSWCRWIALCK